VTVLPLETPVMAMSNGRLTACKVVLIDLSAGGAGLIAPKVLDIGTVIGINPPLFDGMPDIDIAAEVVWQTRLGHFWRIGTRFTGVTSEQQERLLRRVSAEERRWINTMDSWG
jgi:c-di-GMP-binding flagellar brake protein YcgR